MTIQKRPRICRSVGEASSLLKSLANPDRLSIVCLLLEGECSVGELEHQLGIRQPTLSQQLSELRSAGILATRREAKYVYYRVADKRAEKIVGTLREIYGDLENWRARLSAGGTPASKSPISKTPRTIDLMTFD
jgi:DNA-binding transcriptional ArsR family regulator